MSGLEVVTPSNQGNHSLMLYTKDLGGSYTYLTVQIYVDNTPPQIISISPANNSHVKGGENVSVTFSDTPFSVTYSWDGSGRVKNLTAIPTDYGDHSLSIRAYDEAGNLLDVTVHYKILTNEEKITPYVGIVVIASVIVGTGAIIKRKTIKLRLGNLKGKLSEKIQSPKRE